MELDIGSWALNPFGKYVEMVILGDVGDRS